MGSDRLADRVQERIEREDALEQWWAAHGKSLRVTLDQYKAYVSVELRKAQVQNVRLTEERDVLVKEVLKLRDMIRRIKETVYDR